MAKKIGIVHYPDYPLSTFDCFRPVGNISDGKLIFLSKLKKCRERPGFSVEMACLIIIQLGFDCRNLEWIAADGYGTTKTNRGIIQLVETGRVDFAVPQTAITNLRYRRVAFTQPTYFPPAPCFLVCHPKHFYRISQWVIPEKVSLDLIGWIGAVFASLVILRLIHRFYLTDKKTKTLRREVMTSSVNVLLVRTTDVSFPGKLHNRLITTMVVLVILKGRFKAGLVSSFTPIRTFPFQSIDSITDSILDGSWRFRSGAQSSSAAEMLFEDDHKDLRRFRSAVLSKLPTSNQKVTVDPLQNDHWISLTDSIFIMALVLKDRQADCICEHFGLGSFHLDGAFAIRKFDVERMEKVGILTEWLRSAGFIQKLMQKYRIPPSNTHLDTKQMLGEGLATLTKSYPMSFHVILAPVTLYLLALMFAAFIFVLEIFCA